ncbi:MAG: class I SAM-dependent methyltransferase [Candidatus Sulfotelmatobacter sp.]
MKTPVQSPTHNYPDDPTQSAGFRVIEDPTYGFRRLEPIPPEAEVSEFYESRYYDLLRKGNRAPEIARLMEGGDVAAKELEWLRGGLYTDILSVLEGTAPGRRLLEVGCGTGDFVAFSQEHGFSSVGTEPSFEAAQRATAQGLTVHNMTLEKFVSHSESVKFDVVVMINVLEHVPDPVRTLQECKQVLAPGGILCVRVPNDFTEIQAAAKEKIGAAPWWIAVPDHINYFNFASLKQTLDRTGFDTVYAQGDFPMEMFLLMGENYIGNPEIGGRCHARRVQFDLGLPAKLRRKIYSALGKADVGRACLVFGKRRPS